MAMFEHLIWQRDRMFCNGIPFRLQHYMSDDWDLGDECFVFYKTPELVDDYEAFFASRTVPRSHVLELGLWAGGSIPFWFETLRPAKLIGLDIEKKADTPYFKRYVEERAAGDRIKTFWGVDQADSKRVREIVDTELGGRIDLVLDDASHIYGPTLASFETLFPMLSPGGIYVIEDWAWEHWREFHDPAHPLARYRGLSDLVCQIVQAVGSSKRLIRSISAYQGFAAIERSVHAAPGEFRLADEIVARPVPAPSGMRRLKRAARELFPKSRRP